MAPPALVLVHGGGLAADSWGLAVAEIHGLAPELTVLAVDLPGRRDKPGDLRRMTISTSSTRSSATSTVPGWGTSSSSVIRSGV
jgi:pimeloyl-ACP methyl ester carboxylesterase